MDASEGGPVLEPPHVDGPIPASGARASSSRRKKRGKYKNGKRRPMHQDYRHPYTYPRPYRRRGKHMFMHGKSRHMQSYLLNNPWSRPMCVFNFACIRIQALFRGYFSRMYGPVTRSEIMYHADDFKDIEVLGPLSLVKTLSENSIVPPQCRQQYKYILVRRYNVLVMGRTGWKLVEKNGARKNNEYRRKPLITSKKTILLDTYLKDLERYKNREETERPEWIDAGYYAWCALKVQNYWRMMRQWRRRQYRLFMYYTISALLIQTLWRTHHYYKLRPEDAFMAVKKIQNVWRSFCNKRVFTFFKELVTFKLKGMPQELLKSICPSEVNACEKGAGVHLRFRLGGYRFPPKVYFKIFTHRAVCDIGAFAPRDYTVESPMEEIQQNNKVTSKSISSLPSLTNIRVGSKYFETKISTNANSFDGWYHRHENNAWRPIASETFEEILTPPWLREKPHEEAPKLFHFSKLRRKEDLKKYRKQRRREWMMKAYKMAKDGEVDRERKKSLRDSDYYGLESGSSATSVPYFDNGAYVGGMEEKDVYPVHEQNRGVHNKKSESFEAYMKSNASLYSDSVISGSRNSASQMMGVGGMMDKDIPDDEILKWSMSLDFDEYTRDWMSTGTSLPSEVTFQSLYEGSMSQSTIVPPAAGHPNSYSMHYRMRIDNGGQSDRSLSMESNSRINTGANEDYNGTSEESAQYVSLPKLV